MEKNLLKESEEKAVYETGLMPPKINPASDNETEESKAQRAALRQASVDMLFSTDISRLDDAGVGALYKSVTGGVWGIPDEDGSFFGKRKSADMRSNVEMLRRFFKGEYNLIEDKEAEEWRQKTWEEKFRYAKEHESAGNILASTVGGERGVTLGEMVYLGAISQNLSYQLMKDKESERAAKDISRRLNYNTMTKEEKRKYEADVISDYEKKLAKREPLVRFLSMSCDLSDRAAYLLAKSYREGKLDVANILSLEEDEQLKVMTTFAEMRGDLTKGRIFGLETDFSTGTAGDRFQMGVYGLQQAVLSLGSDLYSFAKDSAVAAWAKVELDGKEREDFYTAWNTLERAKLFEKQSLPDAESFGGEAFQTFMENAHWVIPYWGAAKIATKGKNVKRAIQAIDNLSDIKKAGKTAALKESLSVSLFTRLSPMKDGIKYADETIGKLLLSVDKYTRELQELGRMRSAYGAAKGGLDAAWVVARGSAFASFAEEYIDTATAAGVSREESILTAVWVGLVNDRI